MFLRCHVDELDEHMIFCQIFGKPTHLHTRVLQLRRSHSHKASNMNFMRASTPAGPLPHARAKARGRAVCCDGQASSAATAQQGSGNWDVGKLAKQGATYLAVAGVGGIVHHQVARLFVAKAAEESVLVQLATHGQQIKGLETSMADLKSNMKTDMARLEARMDTGLARLDTGLASSPASRYSRLEAKMDTGFAELRTSIAELRKRW